MKVTSLPHTPQRPWKCATTTPALRLWNSNRQRRRSNVKEDRAAIKISHLLLTESELRMPDSHTVWTVMTVFPGPRKACPEIEEKDLATNPPPTPGLLLHQMSVTLHQLGGHAHVRLSRDLRSMLQRFTERVAAIYEGWCSDLRTMLPQFQEDVMAT